MVVDGSSHKLFFLSTLIAAIACLASVKYKLQLLLTSFSQVFSR
jgi:hypothetical protein